MGILYSKFSNFFSLFHSREILWTATKYWGIAEFTFYVYYRMRVRNLQSFSKAPPLLPQDNQRNLIHKVWETFSVVEREDGLGIKDFFSGWFYGAPFESIKRGNLEEFLSCVLFSRFPNGLSKHERSETSFIINLLEERSGIQFPTGKTPSLNFMRLALDPCPAIHRPLCVYIFFYWLTCIADLYLRYLGFELHTIGTLRYWYRPASSDKKDRSHEYVEPSATWNGKDELDVVDVDPLQSQNGWEEFYAKSHSISSAGRKSTAFESQKKLNAQKFSWPSSQCDYGNSADETSSDDSPSRNILFPNKELYNSETENNHADSFSKQNNDPFVAKEDLSNVPIVFLHGVGVGLLGYLTLILDLEGKSRHRPLFLVELPYVSMRLWEHIPTPFETADLMQVMLDHHSYTKASFVGHSFGSISVAWVLKMRPEIVYSVVLLDPVTLLLCWPKTTYNFLYKSKISSIYDLVIRFCSSELSMSRTMYRHFWWYLNTLWSEELPSKCAVFLSAQDTLVPSFRVKRHLEMYSPTTRVFWMPDVNHAEFLLYPKAVQKVCDVIASS